MPLCSNINLTYLYYIYIYIYIYIICDICLISKWSSSIDQIVIKLKHKVKWMARFLKTTARLLIHIHYSVQVSTWERLS